MMTPVACDVVGALILAAIVAFMLWSFTSPLKPVAQIRPWPKAPPPAPVRMPKGPYAPYELDGEPPVIVHAVPTPVPPREPHVRCCQCEAKLPFRMNELAGSIDPAKILCLRCTAATRRADSLGGDR